MRGGQTIVDSRIGGYNITGLDEDTMYVIRVGVASRGSTHTLTASTLEAGEREIYSTRESNSETPLIVTLMREKLECHFGWERVSVLVR